MSDTAYPPSVADVSAKLGSATVALQLVTQELVAVQQVAAATSGAALVQPGNALGTFSTSGSVTTFKNVDGSTAGTLVVSAAGTATGPASAPILFTDSAGVVQKGTLSANSSGSTVTITNPNGLQVAQFTVQPGVTPAISIGTVSTGPTASASISGSVAAPSLNLVLPQGTPGNQGVQGIQGNVGSAAGGDVGTNLVTSMIGGKSIALATVLRRTLHSDDFGSQHSGTTIQGATGLTTRSAVAAFTNAYGSNPYAFFANYPVSTGDDVEVYAPAPTASGNTLVLARSFTLPAAASGYTGPTGLYQSPADGHWYLYTAGQPWADWQPGMYAAFPGLSSNTKILATMGNCVRVTDQPAGTTCAAGVVGTVGANMSALKAGQQVWAAQGIQPFSLISSVGALSVILSKAVDTTSTDSYGRTISGVFQLQPLHVFTPMAEGSICGTMTMDSLAAPATWFNQRTDDASHEKSRLSRGDHVINVGIRLWGKAGGLHGCGMHDTFLRSQCNAFALVSVFPTRATASSFGDFSIRPYSGAQQAGLYIEGCSEDAPLQNLQNTGAVQVDIRHVTGACSGGSTPAGPAQLIRLRHVGGCFLEDISHTGYGLDPSPAASCTLSIGNVVAVHCKRVGGNYGQAAILGEGYLEHPLLEDCSTDPSGTVLDLDTVSTLTNTGVGCLICEIRGGDIDIFYAGYRIVLATAVTFNGTEIQAPEAARAKSYGLNTAPIIDLRACYGGTIVGLNGGTGSTSYDAIQLNNFNLDGRSQGTTGMLLGFINGGGFAATIRVAAGCNGNTFDDKTILLNGSPFGAIIDGGNNTHTTATTLNTAANLAGNQAIGAAVSTIAMAAGDDQTGAFAGNLIACVVNGIYEASGWIEVAPSGSSQTVGTGTVVSSPAGTLVQMQIYGQNPGLSAPAEAYDTTADGGVFPFYKRFFAAAGSKIGMSAAAATTTVVIGAGMTVKLVHAT